MSQEQESSSGTAVKPGPISGEAEANSDTLRTIQRAVESLREVDSAGLNGHAALFADVHGVLQQALTDTDPRATS